MIYSIHEHLDYNNQKTDDMNDNKYKSKPEKTKKDINSDEETQYSQPLTIPEINSRTVEESIQHTMSLPNKTTPASIENNNTVSKPEKEKSSDNNTSERINIPNTSFNSLKSRALTQSYPGIIEKRSAGVAKFKRDTNNTV